MYVSQIIMLCAWNLYSDVCQLLNEVKWKSLMSIMTPKWTNFFRCLRHKVTFFSSEVVPNSLWPYGLHSAWNSPGQNTGVGSLSLLQGIFSTQGLNTGLLLFRWIFLPAEPQGKPKNTGVGCRGPAPVDPGNSKRGWCRRRSGNNCLIKC